MTTSHPLRGDAMGVESQSRYEIRVRGLLGPTFLDAFPTLSQRRHGGDTLLTGLIEDQSALFGVVHNIESLGLELVELRFLNDCVAHRLDADVSPSSREEDCYREGGSRSQA